MCPPTRALALPRGHIGAACMVNMIELALHSAHPSPQPNRQTGHFCRFWATVCKTVHDMLSERCLSCLSACPICFAVSHTHYYVASHRVAWSTGQSITLVSPAKTAKAIKLLFAFRTLVAPLNHVLYMTSTGQHRKGNFEWETGRPLLSIGILRGHLCKHG